MNRHPRRALAAALALLGSSGATGVAHAETDPYTLAVQQTLSHDSNVYRAPSTTPHPPTDWISTTSVIGSLDQPVGRERLKLNGEFDINRFRYDHQLDSTAHSVSGEFDWSTVGRLSGEVGAAEQKSLYRFALDNGTVQTQSANIQSTDQAFARARVGVVTDWTINAAATLYQRSFSVDQYKFNDQRRHDASLGVSWRDTPDLTLSLTGRRTIGEYPDIGAGGDRYDRNDVTAGLVYVPTGASTLRASFGESHEQHSIASQRDAHRWNANVGWQWQPTGRTQLSLGFVRDNDTGDTEGSFLGIPIVNTDARLRTGWNAAFTYALTGKINLTGSGSYAVRQLDSALVFGSSGAGASRISDRLYQASLGIDWRPSRAVDLSCSGSRERRVAPPPTSATALTYPYGTVVLVCTGQFTFN